MKCKRLRSLGLRIGLNPFFAVGPRNTPTRGYFAQNAVYAWATSSSVLCQGGYVLPVKPQVSDYDGDKRWTKRTPKTKEKFTQNRRTKCSTSRGNHRATFAGGQGERGTRQATSYGRLIFLHSIPRWRSFCVWHPTSVVLLDVVVSSTPSLLETHEKEKARYWKLDGKKEKTRKSKWNTNAPYAKNQVYIILIVMSVPPSFSGTSSKHA